MTLTILKDTGQLFCTESLNWVGLMFSHGQTRVMGFGEDASKFRSAWVHDINVTVDW